MANPNAPHGFAPVITAQGNDWNAKCNLYFIPSTDGSAYYIGDAVKTFSQSATRGLDADTGNIWGTMGIQRVQKSTGANSERSRGIIVSMFRDPFNLDTIFIPATKTKNYYVLVMDDPYAVFEIQGDNAGTLPYPSIGSNALYTPAAPSGISPVSATVLATGTIATTNTFPLKILGVAQRINADDSAFTPLIVTWNTHELKGDTGSTPV